MPTTGAPGAVVSTDELDEASCDDEGTVDHALDGTKEDADALEECIADEGGSLLDATVADVLAGWLADVDKPEDDSVLDEVGTRELEETTPLTHLPSTQLYPSAHGPPMPHWQVPPGPHRSVLAVHA